MRERQIKKESRNIKEGKVWEEKFRSNEELGERERGGCFYDISTTVGYLMPYPLYPYISKIYDLVWLGFMAYQPL